MDKFVLDGRATRWTTETFQKVKHLFEHFANEGHSNFIEDVTITFIDKDPNRREHYWRHALKTMGPLDLNAKDN